MTGLLRLENAALGLLAVGAYWHGGAAWWLFALLFFAPDLSFVFYLRGPRLGAIGYNVFHSWIGPVAAGAAGWFWQEPLMVTIALIWAAHIGFDRALGYGLKHQSGFGDTHLGRIGKNRTGQDAGGS